MWYVERSDEPDSGIWTLMMASPHRVGIDDLHGPPGPHYNNQTFGGDMFASLPTPGNKTCFAGKRGSHARVRHNDIMVELYAWDRVPENEFDPDPDYKWGWKLVTQNYASVPHPDLWPMSFG